MSDDGEIQRLTEIERVANGKPSHFQMDAAFCARMYAAIAAGLERADWCHHHAWNQKSKIHSHKTSGTLLAGDRPLV